MIPIEKIIDYQQYTIDTLEIVNHRKSKLINQSRVCILSRDFKIVYQLQQTA